MSNPLVTIGVPLYNHEAYITECLRSLTQQTYTPVEIIVIDDGSTDQSYDVARSYLETQTDNVNFKISTQANQGMCNTMNRIAAMASGEFISFIGSDDYWMPDKIADQAAFLIEHPDVMLVHSCSIRIDSNGIEIGKLNYPDKVKEGYLFDELVTGAAKINTTSHLYRRAVFNDIGYYDPTFSFEDTDFWLRLCKDHKVGFIDREHCAYRWHGENLSDPKNSLLFYNAELQDVYRKNVADKRLLNVALRKIHKRSAKKAWRSGEYGIAWSELRQFIRPNPTYSGSDNRTRQADA
jgi:glycosyltransferase involved in cell wall biosynthesis